MKTKTNGRGRPNASKRDPATGRKAAQRGPQASIATPPAPEAVATETAASGRAVGEVEAVEKTTASNEAVVSAEPAEANDAAAVEAEAHRLAFALSKKPRDRQRAKALVAHIEANPRIERNSHLHGQIEAATRLLAETGRPKVVPDGNDFSPAPAAQGPDVPAGNVGKPPTAKDGLSAGALELLRAVVSACGGEVGHRVDYHAIETPDLSMRQRTGLVAALLKRGFVRTHWAPRRPQIEIEITTAGLQVAAQADG